MPDGRVEDAVGDNVHDLGQQEVCLLHKCLEGLKQAGNVWQTTHTAWLIALKLLGRLRFTQSDVEPCLFIMHASDGLLAILVWIDDILVALS